ncbi:S8 family serine peptidase [Pseudofrankia sp. BMG5.37]|uniref:S8 family peptidase n=1 Tax=Pseudofrankia sp. BMG5.37 TaxID=3050035 RepID=UPI0028961359|nr:S8 family serine peptidase [Pseudofrankia sp. BMG5.37]MDT3440440.1 S8 family serine peptidase [Pseudofrankia sp. BMG5.37]
MRRALRSPTPPTGERRGRRRSRRLALLAAPVAAMVAVPLALTLPGSPASAASSRTYVVVYSGSAEAGRAAVAKLGGKIESENAETGLAVVTSTDASFETRAATFTALVGAAPDSPIGYAAPDAAGGSAGGKDQSFTQRERDLSRAGGGTKPGKPGKPAAGAEPLSSLQWDMQMMGATPTGSYKYQPGNKGVLVGVIDTGIDGTHPDVAPNFDKGLSRNFVTDIPTDPASGEEVDGPCEHPSCKDPVDEDDDGHGTHVASTIASPVNGLGIAGVAPNVQLVNIRAGQDSGYFFLKPTIDAITYAGDAGIDVVNMSFYTDPYLFNCEANPADSPERQAEQRTIIAATQRAVAYASRHGVTLIAASGNESTDLGHPAADDTSPDYPPSGSAAYPRVIDNSCLSMPSEAPNVLDVNAIGPSKRLSYYSNYGLEQSVVAAPGGDAYDGSATRLATNEILAAYPKNVAEATGDIDENGNPTNEFVIRDDSKGKTSYYQYLQGTSMASPHAVGVAAIIISALGHKDPRHGGLTVDPQIVQQALQRTAVATACPTPNPYVYPAPVPADYTKTCQGTAKFNGFYGNGIVSALNASKLH